MKDGIHSKTEGFGGNETATEVNEEQERKAILQKKLQAHIRDHLAHVHKELESGELHGIVIVRVNAEHDVATCVSICNAAAADVAMKLQQTAMDLMIPPEAQAEIQGLIGLLSKLRSGRREN